MTSNSERVLFVTGKLAEASLRRVLEDLRAKLPFEPVVQALPITVAALLTTSWVARHLTLNQSVSRIVLPGFTRGELDELAQATGVSVELGPKDLRDLPEYLGQARAVPPQLDRFDMEIVAEINHAPTRSLAQLLAQAQHYRDSGADVIDLGCDPGATWSGIGEAVRMLRQEGFRVSVDSFNSVEVRAALQAGAELVLSVNSTNLAEVPTWQDCAPSFSVVAIPDTPTDLESLVRTAEQLRAWNIAVRLDPILEPIGFGFAASLGRYAEVRRRFPEAEMLMGVGNLTELTEVDSAGVNMLLAGYCQELGIRSILTTEVINWGRSAVREFDIARRVMFHAVREGVLPKRLDARLVMLRDRKLNILGEAALAELAALIKDRNYRLFAEQGELHLMNGELYLRGTDPFMMFEEVLRRDAKMDASHAFYLGYEFAKAVTALTLGKNYTQDQALNWGFLTRPEISHRGD